jgi:hypothetical protein
MPDTRENRPRADNQDPTANVLLILNSEIKGLKNLFDAYKEAAAIHIDERFKRVDDRFLSHLEHTRETVANTDKEFKTHVATSREMNSNEQKRLDALIAGIVQTAADVNAQTIATAATLQGTVASTAEAARVKLEATELALRTGNAQSTETLARTITAQNEDNAKRFKALEDARSELVGKDRVADPLMASLVSEMKSINEFRNVSTGKVMGVQAFWGYIVAAISAGMFIHSYMK